jgi:hypothetical protein
MPHDHLLLIYYLLFLAARIRGCFRRWGQPLLRGPEYFFSVPVSPDFPAGVGRKILLRYRLRMFIPFVLDIPIAIAVFIPGHLQSLVWLLLAQVALIHVNHVFSVDIAERQARRFAIAETEKPVGSLVLSLKTRRLRDYSNLKLEAAIALSSTIAIGALIRYYVAAPEHHDVRLVFGGAAVLLYTQLGFLFAKWVIVAWRTPVPQAQAEEYLAAREEARKLYLQVCDWCRINYSVPLLLCPVLLYASPGNRGRYLSILFGASLAVAVVLAIWQEIRRKQVLAVSLRARPATLPELLSPSESLRWPLCYQPTAPMLVLKGARGYSLNLANTMAQFGAAYLAGFVALVAVLRMGR